MAEINKKLRSSLLPAPMIIKNYVIGDENCNYEKYLLEIVNASQVFRLLSGGKEYTAPDNEAHGENDGKCEQHQAQTLCYIFKHIHRFFSSVLLFTNS